MSNKKNKTNDFIDQVFDANANKIIQGYARLNEKKGSNFTIENISEIKNAFRAMVKDYMVQHKVYYKKAVKKVLNAESFTPKKDREEKFINDLLEKYLSGKKQIIKNYLGLPYRSKLIGKHVDKETGEVKIIRNVNVEWDMIEDAWALSFGSKTIYVHRGGKYEEEGFTLRFPR